MIKEVIQLSNRVGRQRKPGYHYLLNRKWCYVFAARGLSALASFPSHTIAGRDMRKSMELVLAPEGISLYADQPGCRVQYLETVLRTTDGTPVGEPCLTRCDNCKQGVVPRLEVLASVQRARDSLLDPAALQPSNVESSENARIAERATAALTAWGLLARRECLFCGTDSCDGCGRNCLRGRIGHNLCPVCDQPNSTYHP